MVPPPRRVRLGRDRRRGRLVRRERRGWPGASGARRPSASSTRSGSCTSAGSTRRSPPRRPCCSPRPRRWTPADAAGTRAPLTALRVRQVVADSAETVLAAVDHALGPAPLTSEEEHAGRVADLRVYLRQHHAERDTAALGARRQCGDRRGDPARLHPRRHRHPGRGLDRRTCAGPTGSRCVLDGVRRLVVVAAHPDDESLGAGGLLATAHERGLEIDLVLLTAGELSHPASPTHSREVLGRRRLAEAKDALPRGRPARRADVHGARRRLGVRRRGRRRRTAGGPDRRRCGHAGRGALAARRPPRPRGGRTGGGHRGPAYGRRAGGVPRLVVALGHARRTHRGPRCGGWTSRRRRGRASGRRSPRTPRQVRAAVGAARRRGAPAPRLPGALPRCGRGVRRRRDAHDTALDDLHRGGAGPVGRGRPLVRAPQARPHAGDAAAARRYPRRSRSAARPARWPSGWRSAASSWSPSTAARPRSRPPGPGSSAPSTSGSSCCEVPHEWAAGPFDLVVVSEMAYFLSPGELHGLVDRVCELPGAATASWCSATGGTGSTAGCRTRRRCATPSPGRALDRAGGVPRPRRRDRAARRRRRPPGADGMSRASCTSSCPPTTRRSCSAPAWPRSPPPRPACDRPARASSCAPPWSSTGAPTARAAVAAAYGVDTVVVDAASVGVARAAGVERVAALPAAIRRSGCSSSAPTRTAWSRTLWLVDLRALVAAGYDLVIGAVHPDPADLPRGVLERWRDRHRRPQAHVHGANLASRWRRTRGPAGCSRSRARGRAPGGRHARGRMPVDGGTSVQTSGRTTGRVRRRLRDLPRGLVAQAE